MSAAREKVVILGGGMAALTTAYALSERGWRDRFESITVYQQGWRLGGKGASGRNAAQHDRIEEHGLHLWLGFYENAFRLMRRCYAELGRRPGAPIATFEDAFEEASFVVLPELHAGTWKSWEIHYPQNARRPGIPDDDDGGLGLLGYLWQAMKLLRSLTRDAGVRVEPARYDVLVRLGEPSLAPETFEAALGPRLAGVEPAALSTAIDLAAGLDASSIDRQPAQLAALQVLVETHVAWAKSRLPGGDRARRLGALIEIVGAIVRGFIADRVPWRGFRAIDGMELGAWLRQHGASAAAVESPIVRGGYDLAFAYRDGDPAQPAMAAGQAIRGLMRLMFEYKGAIFWRMQAGMGDVVFAPLYQVLKRRGVGFRFFHRVKRLRLTPDGSAIGGVELARQVELVSPDVEYDPLVEIGGLPCWPSEPRYAQIADGEALRGHDLESFWKPWPHERDVEPLRAGRDFDRLVFGISLGAVPYVCDELVSRQPQWSDMVAHVKTVQTQAFQLWLTKDFDDLGGPADQATSSGFVEPFDTCADMRHLVERESWPDTLRPRGVAYFCNAMPTAPGHRPAPDPAFADGETARVRDNAITFLRRDVPHIWPKAIDPATGDFRWDDLVAPAGAGVARFDAQYWKANVDPSERYVQSLPGTNQYRLAPGAAGCDRFYVVGDWTDCGFNVGCIEAAVMSGLLGSHAISGSPALGDIVGYDAVRDAARSEPGPHFVAGAVAPVGTPLVPRPIREDGARRILAMTDPALRNLWITQAYNELAAGLHGRLAEPNANWCGIATWASKTVGRFIRGEYWRIAVGDELRRSPMYQTLLVPVGPSVTSTPSGVPGDSVADLEAAVIALFDNPFRVASRALAEGNRTVFEELAPVFGRLGALFDAGTPDAAAIAAFLRTVQAIDHPVGTEELRATFAIYCAVPSLAAAAARAQRMLLANGMIAWIEQTRLQPFIATAMEPFGSWAPAASFAPTFDQRVDVVLSDWSDALPAGDSRRARIEAQRASFKSELRRIWRAMVTAFFLTIEWPGERLSLGVDVPPVGRDPFPPELATIADPDTLEFLDTHDPPNGRGRNYGASDWSALAQRMRFIVNLFRSRQQHGPVMTPPFTDDQVAAMQEGRIPPGDL